MAKRSDAEERTTAQARRQPVDVRSVELEDDDGNPVVISQQNVGPGNQVGEGEFKEPKPPKDPGVAAEEQSRLE